MYGDADSGLHAWNMVALLVDGDPTAAAGSIFSFPRTAHLLVDLMSAAAEALHEEGSDAAEQYKATAGGAVGTSSVHCSFGVTGLMTVAIAAAKATRAAVVARYAGDGPTTLMVTTLTLPVTAAAVGIKPTTAVS